MDTNEPVAETPMLVVAEQMRQCKVCGETRTIDRFSPAWKGTGHVAVMRTCKKCVNRQAKLRRRAKAKGLREVKIGQLLGQILKSVGDIRLEPPKMGQLVDELWKKYGGPAGLAAVMHEAQMVAFKKNPGSPATLNGFASLTKLMMSHAELQEASGRLATPDELRAAIQSIVLQASPRLLEVADAGDGDDDDDDVDNVEDAA